MQRFREGLVVKADRLLYHSTLGSRAIKKRKKKKHPTLSGCYPLCYITDRALPRKGTREMRGMPLKPRRPDRLGVLTFGRRGRVCGSGRPLRRLAPSSQNASDNPPGGFHSRKNACHKISPFIKVPRDLPIAGVWPRSVHTVLTFGQRVQGSGSERHGATGVPRT